MRTLRYSLVASAALLPMIAQAQQSETLDEISVVATTPVGASSGIGRGGVVAAPQAGAEQTVPPALPADTRLRGGAQPLYKIPSTVESVTASAIEQDTGTFNAVATLARVTPGLNLSDAQGNNNRVDVNYRGFQASPVQGVPQGLAVYQNGVRINEAFGDVVNFDLIPPSAIQRIDIVSSNPIFGLNALGGAVNIQMKNGFTWQGTEITALGGSDGRIAGGLQYGKQVGDWSFYFNGDGLNDRGWRYDSPSTIGRIYTDLGYRSQDSEFHVIGQFARTFFGAASATPVDFTRVDPRAIFTNPQTTTQQVGTLQVTGRVDISPTWDLSGNAYFRRYSNQYIDGNDAEFERCGNRCSTPNAIRLDDDDFPGFTRDQLRLRGANGQLIPFTAGVPYATLDTTKTEATGYGGSLQAANRDRVFGFGNSFVIGGSIDVADYSFKSSSTLGVINPNDLSVGTDPNNPFYGFVAGLGTPFLRTDGAVGYAPSAVVGSNLYMGLYATDTFDLTDQLSLTAGARLNFARITTRDLTGFSPDVNGVHYFTKINPVAGLTYRFLPGLSLYGSYSESNRAPTPLELACANPLRPCLLPNSLVADPPLQQVTSQNYEVGIRGTIPNFYDGGALSYKVGAFRNDLANDILQLAVPGNAARGYYVNVPATRREGIEVSGEYARGDLSIYANYALINPTFQFSGELSSPNNPLSDDGAIFVTPGKQVPLIPNHQFKVGFDYQVLPGWRVGMNLQAFSSAYFRGDESNINRKLPAYFVLGLNTSYQVNKNLQLFGLVTNLTNNRYATFGTFAETGAVAGNYVINDPRSTTFAQPLSIYGGVRYTFGDEPAPMQEPIIRKY
ncbi:TonB-dependent receptor [Methylobacterium gnaphalii]|uniref:Membrane protein n=1 Tax=Methylobacterium gnaphalii TaxID=1010610 RepID=A0A512JGR0_9HYPH|nr:TonB-dependent receptor [Methylobacterium gnaphalii]GEP09032.1 membrane protein [Methylobacterium gnaphalii]GJD68342.1 Vitamin B12 transporter BtuB [Methylobacterium gnaphalii]GLS48956.1 membrane protein [Methylobacterium gnaphalii]